MAQDKIKAALGKYTEGLMSVPGVVGVAEGFCDGRACIKVFVVEKTPELEKEVSGILGNIPVEIEETGEFRALPEED